ncbi:hypothetical protein ACJ4V0_15830 [Phreatobacter sp. HK31-P]
MDRPLTDAELLDAMRLPLLRAMEDTYADIGSAATDRAILRQLLKSASDTERRLPDREKGYVYSMRTVWPSGMVDREGELGAYEETLRSIQDGTVSTDALAPRFRVTAAEVTTYEIVTMVIPKLLVGSQRKDDWTAMWLAARGMERKAIAKVLGLHWSTVGKRLDRQWLAVSVRLKPYYPTAAQWAFVEKRLGPRNILPNTHISGSS